MRKSKRSIVLDLDETLIDSLNPLWKIHCRLSGTRHDSPQRHAFDYHRIWQIDPDYCNHMMRTYMSGGHVQKPRVLPGAKRALLQLSETHLLIVTTARNAQWYPQTMTQLQAIGCDFHEVHLCTDKNGETTPKALVCREYGYDKIVDDHVETATECAAIGMDVFLFGRYPWTITPIDPLNRIRHVHNWRQAYTGLMSTHRA